LYYIADGTLLFKMQL